MFTKRNRVIVLLCCLIFSVFSAPRFPFPQQFKYRYGIMPEGVDHKAVQTVYEVWLKNYYEESGNQARIKFDEPENTVSEGIGYGMLIMVYMDNEKNNTQPKFDKLYNYYKAHLDGNGLMHWKIQGFTNNVIGSGAATDADLDVAVALIMAEKQWGDTRYLTEAKSLIEKIKKYEIAGNNLIKGGDQWDAINPSYMSMVATQLFYNITNDNKWTAVQEACYQELQRSQHPTTGLWPNWSQGGTGSYPQIYGFDACRTPWRLGWVYVWYGHSQAKSLCSKLIDYFSAQTNNNPGATGQMYNLDGTINKEAKGSETCIPTFLGPFTVGGMVDSKYQTWVNNGYKKLLSYNSKNDNYYNECLELLCMLLLTGNMPDFTKEQPRTTATLTVKVYPQGAASITISPQKSTYNVGEQITVSTSPTSSRYKFVGWDGDIKETTQSVTFKISYNMIITAIYKDEEADDLVDDCEDGDAFTYLGSEWFSYTDVLDSGK
ncbi:MAG: glycosyl hydrolase family 8, partial [Chitinispirillaceae bacterium]|nr:glycosyl hydrolase family 8 [Chitinispirillaceae bacterium]